MHLATWPPKCADCGRFMPAHRSRIERQDYGLPMVGADDFETGVCANCEEQEVSVNGFVIIPDAMEKAMQRDLNRLRDSLPEDERDAFEAERHIHRQTIINHYAEHGTYPVIDGVEKSK